MTDNAPTAHDPRLLDELRSLGRAYGDTAVALAAVSLVRTDDEVEVYLREDGDYGWRLQAGGNHEPLAGPGEGYESKTHAMEAAVDRKSTRLNSSHVEISYAVFCLKKKKKKHTRDDVE